MTASTRNRLEKSTVIHDSNFGNITDRNVRKESKSMQLVKENSEVNVEAFSMRPGRMDDLLDSVELFEACSIDAIGVSDVNPDEVKNEWQIPKFSLEKSVRVVHNSIGKMVGYVEVWDIDANPVSIWVWPRIHPDYEGQGVGVMLMEWAENRALEAVVRVPHDIQVVMEVGTYHLHKFGHERLQKLDLKLVRQFLTMSIELSDPLTLPQWPEGISIRTMAGEEEAKLVLKAVFDAFQDHWGFVQQPLEERLERWMHFIQNSDDFDADLWFLAMDGSEVAGMSLCWPKANEDPEMGWVGTLGVRKPWRKQGLGLALLHHSFAVFADRGQKRVGLGVDGQSLTGATRLYKKAGMSSLPDLQYDLYQKVLRPGRDISKQEL